MTPVYARAGVLCAEGAPDPLMHRSLLDAFDLYQRRFVGQIALTTETARSVMRANESSSTAIAMFVESYMLEQHFRCIHHVKIYGHSVLKDMDTGYIFDIECQEGCLLISDLPAFKRQEQLLKLTKEAGNLEMVREKVELKHAQSWLIMLQKRRILT
ncbi:hypothetical protein ACI2KR_09295 [Pseudomonas luteola]